MSRKTRNLIWSVPLVATLAIVGALALFITLAPNDASAQQGEEAPGMPTELMLRALDETTIELTWKAPSDEAGGSPDGYRIDYSADGLIWYSLAPNHSALKYVDNKDLEASETRYYRIFAFNTGGSSRILGPESVMTTASTKPEAPTALVVNPGVDTEDPDGIGDADEEHLVVSWDPPVDPRGAPVTTFRLQVSKNENSGFFDLKGAEALKAKDVCSGTGASRVCTHTNVDLFENNEQFYRVYASNSVGESPASEVRGDKTVEGTEPTEPLSVRAALSTAGRMVLYWDRPLESPSPENTGKYDPPGAPITGYFIQGGPVLVAETGAPTAFVQTDTTEPASQDPDVDEVLRYTAGTDVPLTPIILRDLATFAGAPDLDGRAEDRTTNPVIEPYEPTQWGFRVMAINRVVEENVADGTISDDDGEWSDFIRVNNDGQLADVLPKLTLEADRHTGSNRGRTGIELEWEVDDPLDERDSANAIEYRVEYSEDRIDWTVLPTEGVIDSSDVFAAPGVTADIAPTDAVAATAVTGVHVGLTASTGYSYRVFAVQPDAAGAPIGMIYTEASSPVSESTTTADRPNTPELTAPIAESETALEMTVVVNEADDDPAESGDAEVGFGALKGYRIEISDDGRDWTKYDPVMIDAKLDVIYSYSEKTGEVTENEQDDEDTEVEFRHTDLTQKSTRYYRASTVNNAPGKSAYSEATDAVKGTTDAALTSDDPGGLVVKAKGRTAIELFWNARADDIEAAEVEKYRIEYSAVDDEGVCEEEWMPVVEETETSATYYEHMGLMPVTGYCYRVFGVNVVGTSTSFVGFGDAYATTYDADAQAITAATMAPGMPMNVMADATSDTMITVTWEAPASSDITGYMVQSAYMGADGMMTEWMDVDPAHMGMDMEYMDTGLMPETMYYYQVRAMNAAGNGEWSDGMASAMTNPTSVMTELGMASNIRIGLNSGGTIQVTWDAADNAGGYIVIAIDRSDFSATSAPINPNSDGITATTWNLGGLTVGNDYYVYVAATGSAGDNTLSIPPFEVTAQ